LCLQRDLSFLALRVSDLQGMDGAGHVSMVGTGVSGLKAGDRVAYVSLSGGRQVFHSIRA